MGCNCSQSKSGATFVYQYAGKTYATQTEADIARTRAGGHGPIVKTSQASK